MRSGSHVGRASWVNVVAGCRRATLNFAVLVAFDCIALITALALALLVVWMGKELLLGQEYEIFHQPRSVFERFFFYCLLVLLCVVISAFKGFYTERAPYWDGVRGTFQLVFLLGLIDAFVQYSSKHDFSRLWLVLTWGVAGPALVLGRSLAINVLNRRGLWQLKTLLVCEPDDQERVLAALDSDLNLGYEVVEISTASELTNDARIKGIESLRDENVDFLIIVPEEGLSHPHTELVLRAAIKSRIPYALIPGVEGLATYELKSQYFYSQDVVLMHARQNLARPTSLFVKSLLDVGCSLVLLVIATPILMVLVILIRLDGGPALYRHVRVGRDGKLFECLKLRTMVPDGDCLLKEFLDSNLDAKKDWDGNHKLDRDPRVTRLGSFLRKYSIDELPQIFNVLRGEMSLVGPRPIVEEEVERYEECFELYQEVRPGITGLWQVSGRNALSYEDRVALDRWYVTNWSVWLDFTILMRTVPTLLFERNGC